MKILISYYSRSNITKDVAEEIQSQLGGDIEEIKDLKSRKGIFGYIIAGMEAARGKKAQIAQTKYNVEDYDLVIVGTPVWAGTMATPIMTYLDENTGKFKNTGFFCTCGSSGYEKTLVNMTSRISKPPVATFYLKKEELKNKSIKIKDFVDKVKANF
ncbi:MAG: flavodoxin family protein [Methanobacteriaceae archaeon]